MEITSQIIYFFRLIRIKNLIILLILQYFCRIFLIGSPSEMGAIVVEKEIFILSFCTLLVAAAGYIINDYYDIKIDLINKPESVIIGKFISRRNSFILQLSLNLLALLLAVFVLSIKVGFFILFCEILLWYYSNRLKRTSILGNITISLLAFCSVYILALYYKTNQDYILFYSLFSFVITYMRELTKDIEDIKGDESYNSQTLPIKLGVPKTKVILHIVSLITILVLIYLRNNINVIHYILLNIMTIILLIFVNIKYYYADKKNDFTVITKILKWTMIWGILTMIFV